MAKTTTKHDDDRNHDAQGARIVEEDRARADRPDLRRDTSEESRDARQRLVEEKPFDFIERTLPEDPTGRGRAQLTRDNVNPAIPSAPPGTGGIVQPQSTSGGVPPPQVVATTPVRDGEVLQPVSTVAPREALPGDPAYMPSVNEPAGTVIGGETPPVNGQGGATDEAPVLTSLTPDSVVLGEPSFTVYLAGTGFTAASVIVFADEDEPTTLETDGTLSTGVNMDVWEGPGVVQIAVRNGDKLSNELEFTFVAAEPEADATSSRGKKSKRRR